MVPMLPQMDVFVPLFLTAALAGAVRGFTGFGPALVFIPIASGIVPPWQAVILLFIIDGVTTLPLIPAAVRKCTWREVAPLTIGAAVTVPVGAYFLLSVDPTALRWALGAMALGAVAILASGWRYRAEPVRLVSAAVGAASGFLGGLCSFYGPPIALFWLGGQGRAETVRANIIVFLAAISVVAGVTFAAHGLFRPDVVVLALALMPIYGAAVWVGTKLFPFASETAFRRIAYLIIAGAAIDSVPAFDRHPQ
jgi:uncharacterized membrane protein YfcA